MFTFLKLHSQRALTLVLPIASLFITNVAFCQVGLGIAPMRQELAIAPGAQRSGFVNVSNDSPNPVRIRAQIMDFFIDNDATPQFQRVSSNEQKFSCRDWLTVNPMEAELKPGEQVHVRYTLQVPAESPSSSYHCAAGFTSLTPASVPQQIGLQMAVRVVAAFYAIVGAPPIRGGVKAIQLEDIKIDGADSPRGIVTLENPGDMHFRPVGELSVLNEEGKVLESVPFIAVPVLPKRNQRFLFPLQSRLAPGKYTLRVRVDIGANEIQEAVVPVTYKTPGI